MGVRTNKVANTESAAGHGFLVAADERSEAASATTRSKGNCNCGSEQGGLTGNRISTDGSVLQMRIL